ncbi:MAG: heme ABC transporter permease CcmC [Pseudomonadota bacterium]|nr:heme ABC transporter permease CcmC [Pseudomonadota bacterium]
MLKFNRILQPETWFNFCEQWGDILFYSLFPLLLFSLVSGAFLAPTDSQQGEVYRVIYVHVPAAAMSLGCYAFIGLCSAIFLLTRVLVFDYLTLATAKVGSVLTLLSLVTGAIWGMPTWGTWWIWDARLTSQLLLLVIYFCYLLVRLSIKPERQARIYASVFAMIGLIDLPIIHFSVQWWATLHQPPTLFKLAKPSMDGQMLWALIIGLFVYFFITVVLILLTLRNDLLIHCRHKKWLVSKKND